MEEKRMHVNVRGIVQGVGFRPFLHRLAAAYGLSGWAKNTSGGVEAELQGKSESCDGFLRELRKNPPPLSVVEDVEVCFLPPLPGCAGFAIRDSEEKEEGTLVSPDLSLCPACERELLDPSDRRYRYPFINCTDCGPRYTITRRLPYDRGQTTMRSFVMCPACRREYEDIRDRRYHAQPDCCPECGPSVYYLNGSGERMEGDPFALAQKELARGGIVAVKGIGGIHLACDGTSAEAILRLRGRKSRPAKPLALMCRSLEEVLRIAEAGEEEKRFLSGPRRPIVLLKKKKEPAVSRSMAQALSAAAIGPRIGLMLPYSPVHVLLLDGHFGGPVTVVMTSANRSGCPVLTEEAEAVEVLSGIADGYLLHNRPIENRCDDSVVMEWQGEEYFLRRSRGYAPSPLTATEDSDGIYAYGAEQKGSFALGRDRHIFLSPYIGDLKTVETADHYRNSLEAYERLFCTRPKRIACDLHPDYISTGEAKKRAEESGVPLLQIQHHWAHMASCMEENGLSGPAFGIIWDGTGLGTDGNIWGAEFLEGDFSHWKRVGSIRPILLAGGDRASVEIGRIALALLCDAGLPADRAPLPAEKRESLKHLIATGLTCVKASSMGRLFDGVCSLLLQKAEITYEGEGGRLLEAVSESEVPFFPAGATAPYPVSFYEEQGLRLFDTRPLLRIIEKEMAAGETAGRIASRFMETLCHMAADQCRMLNRKRLPVVLSGGVFQNRFLLSGVSRLLLQDGFSVFCHHQIPAGDDGISVGQLAIARAAEAMKAKE